MEGVNQVGMPEGIGVRTGVTVRVEGIQTVVFSGYKDDVVSRSIDRETRDVERLRKD